MHLRGVFRRYWTDVAIILGTVVPTLTAWVVGVEQIDTTGPRGITSQASTTPTIPHHMPNMLLPYMTVHSWPLGHLNAVHDQPRTHGSTYRQRRGMVSSIFGSNSTGAFVL